jgi:hypothetical protein
LYPAQASQFAALIATYDRVTGTGRYPW